MVFDEGEERLEKLKPITGRRRRGIQYREGGGGSRGGKWPGKGVGVSGAR